MKYIELNNVAFNAFTIIAVMCHPDEVGKRNEYWTCLLIKMIVETSADGEALEELPSSMLEVLLNAPSYTEVHNRAIDNSIKGHVAGLILLSYAFMAETDQEEPSMRKAKHITSWILKKHSTGSSIGKTLPSLDKFWSEFRSVAHLWAAFLVLQEQGSVLLSENVNEFLGIAEWFREFGEGCFPSRVKNSEALLDPEQTWRPHPDYLILTATKGYPEKITFPECMANALKSYKSKR